MPVAIYLLLPLLEKPISLNPQKKTSGFETVEITKHQDDLESKETVGPDKEKKNETQVVPAVAPPTKETDQSVEKPAASISGMKEKNDKKNKKKDSQDGYQIIYHTVSPNESLYIISMNYYKSDDGIGQIKKWNHLKGDEIQVGQVLKIPLEGND